MSRSGVLFEPFAKLETIHAAHHDVHEEHARQLLAQHIQRLNWIRGGGDIEPIVREEPEEHFTDARVIIHYEDRVANVLRLA